MFNKFTTILIRKLGKEGYSPDSTLSSRDFMQILLSRFCQLMRGYRIKYFLGKSEGMLFVGRRCKITSKSRIFLGRTIQIGDNVEINALSRKGIRIGNNFSIQRNSIIECTGVIRNLGEGLIIGNNVGIAQNCFIQVRGAVEIGDNVLFGPGSSLFSENHNFSDPELSIKNQGEVRKGVVIENDVWIGTRAVILDGVRIGTHSVVAAGSVINKDVPPYSVVGGVPGKVLRRLTEE